MAYRAHPGDNAPGVHGSLAKQYLCAGPIDHQFGIGEALRRQYDSGAGPGTWRRPQLVPQRRTAHSLEIGSSQRAGAGVKALCSTPLIPELCPNYAGAHTPNNW
jgi:hypothetical protein